MKRYKTVDAYIEGAEDWQDELIQLRKILNSTGLEETVKWGAPSYTLDGKLVVGIGAFKSYVGIWFYQGALLKDEQGVLINAQEGKTKALRQWRFASKKEIKTRLIKAYVKEAMELQKEGKAIKPTRGKPVDLPPQLKSALTKHKKAKAGYDGLSLGKKREYAEYIESAKREETKVKRLEKIIPMLVEGIGLNDKYR